MEDYKKWAALIMALICFNAAAATYWANTNSIGDGSGSSAENAMALQTALNSCGANSTVMVLPGIYSGQVRIMSPYTTLRSSQKWGARIVGGSPYALTTWLDDSGGPQAHHAVIDGFEVTGSVQTGIGLYGISNTVRNCWVHHCGNGTATQNSSGICEQDDIGGGLFEYNLCETNGYNENGPFDHGIYINGKPHIVRFNVCRGNWGCGIAGRSFIGDQYIYGNLCYNNRYYGITVNETTSDERLYIYGNTVYQPGGWACFAAWGSGTAYYTNNICIGGAVLDGGSSCVIRADYNLQSNVNPLSQVHGVNNGTVASVQFVNPSSGLFWLQSGSVARGLAAAGVHPSTDFWGQAQGAISDIGAFQYSAAYAADTRTLYPTPAGGADYWAILGDVVPAPTGLKVLGIGSLGVGSY